MQKLVTIYLDNAAYREGKWPSKFSNKHGIVEEHLDEYLNDGWRITAIEGFGGHGPTEHVRGWVAAVLEKE
jgi:hypothetical protein